MRDFPLEHEENKTVQFYPSEPNVVTGDILEIGPGNGRFLMKLARENADKQIVALELDRRRYNRICRRLEKSGIDNVLIIWGNARVTVPRYLSTCRFERIYALFPDPWPKRRHAPHRLMTGEFLGQLSNILQPTAELYIATDVSLYAEQIARTIAGVATLQLTDKPYSPVAAVRDYEPTFFEGLATRAGVKINYLIARIQTNADTGVE